jgi:hypothetical protein
MSMNDYTADLYAIYSYKQRLVANTKFDDDRGVIDTVLNWDGKRPYETGIRHPDYAEGRWIIVEAYNTKEDAQKGHDEWVTRMTSDQRPEKLTDCNNSIELAFYKAVIKSLEDMVTKS